MKTLVASTGNVTVTNSQVIDGVEFGDKIAQAIAKAVNDGTLTSIGLDKDTEDDGTGVMKETGKYEIVNETAFADFIASTDTAYAYQVAPVANNNISANQSASQIWLQSNTNVKELPRTTQKVVGKVLRYHISMLDKKPIGVSVTFQSIDGTVVKNDNTALLSMSYLESVIGKGTLDAAKMLTWADEKLKNAVIVLGARTTASGETGYFRSLETLNDTEMKAYKGITDKSQIKKNDRGQIGFVHRVSNTSHTYVGIASETETLQFNTAVSRLSELTIKVAEKAAMDSVELASLDKRNQIDAQALEHQLVVAKSLLDKGILSPALFEKRVEELMSKFGMK